MRRTVFRIFVLIIPFILSVFLLTQERPVAYAEFKGKISSPPPKITVISSEDDLKNYMEKHIISSEICPYDEEYFAENVLLAVYISEPSEDISHDIISVKDHNGDLTVTVKRQIPARLSSVKGAGVYLIETERNTVCGINNYSVSFT